MAPFQGGADGPPVGDLAPRQCVLSLTAPFVFLVDHAPGLWLDNLALRYTGATDVGPLVHSIAPTASPGPGALWLTDVVVVGNGLAPGLDIDFSSLFASGALLNCAKLAVPNCACLRLVCCQTVLLQVVAPPSP